MNNNILEVIVQSYYFFFFSFPLDLCPNFIHCYLTDALSLVLVRNAGGAKESNSVVSALLVAYWVIGSTSACQTSSTPTHHSSAACETAQSLITH